MINGLINVYKETGFTSFDVVAVMRGISGQRKIGHTGTLDPQAEGVLPICLGNATKLCDMLNDKRKEYVATFMLGRRTDTLDDTGEVLEERPVVATKESILGAVKSFVGGYNQLPPMFSAKWVDGKRLYDLARKGISVERTPVFVEIFDIEVMDVSLPYVTIRVECGKGTYIRSLCEDIAAKCGDIAVMTKLIRTKVDEFTTENARTLSELTAIKNEGNLLSVVTPTDFCFMKLKKVRTLKDFRKYIDNGNKLRFHMVDVEDIPAPGERVRVYNDEDIFVGVFYYDKEDESLKPEKMFLEQ